MVLSSFAGCTVSCISFIVFITIWCSSNVSLLVTSAPAPPLSRPTMGWMAWQQFRCALCDNATDYFCVNEQLLVDHATILNTSGLLALGYHRVHIDDCAIATERDPIDNYLPLDPLRFPSGLEGVVLTLRTLGVELAVYSAESLTTCSGFPGSRGFEYTDASYWYNAGVTYAKLDGCGDPAYFDVGFPLLGNAIAELAKANNLTPMIFSCSWPDYDNSFTEYRNWTKYIEGGCVTGRTFADMQCAWDGPPPLGGTPLIDILNHYGDYSAYLQNVTSTYNFLIDGDMLLAGATNPDNGAPCLTFDEERSQFAIYSIMAFPLIFGNDLRNISNESLSIVMNPDAIAVNQDGGVVGGRRITPNQNLEVWARNLTSYGKYNGSGKPIAVAVALFNKNGFPAPCPTTPTEWVYTGPNWFYEAGEPCGSPNGDTGCFNGSTTDVQQAIVNCCNDPLCAGFSYNVGDGSGGCYKTNQTCRVNQTGLVGYYKPSSIWPPPPPPNNGVANITVNLQDIYLDTFDPSQEMVEVYDIWQRTVVANITTNINASYTGINIPLHGTAFYRMRIVPLSSEL